MQQGDIVVINFPFTSLRGSKIRPALIVSNETFNDGINVILLAIFGKNNNYSEELKQNDLLEGKLNKKSYVRFSNILSLEKGLLLRKIGSLNKKATKRIADQLSAYLS